MSGYTISELAALSGLSVRTIRYYVAEGLIPPAGMEGPATRYPASTLARLRLMDRLKDAHLPLAEIRKRLRALSDEEVQGLASHAERAEPADSALDYIRSVLSGGKRLPAGETMTPAYLRPGSTPASSGPTRLVETGQASGLRARAPAVEYPEPFDRSRWERVEITPDVELHIRRPLSRRDTKMAERLLAFARQLQGEETP